MQEEYVKKYIRIIRKFIEGETSASEFSTTYMNEFKNDDVVPDEDVFGLLDHLFTKSDAYCEPEIREDTIDGIGEEELRESAIEIIEELQEILQNSSD